MHSHHPADHAADHPADHPAEHAGEGADGHDWRAALRERGYRLTPQRELILGAVDELGHATPDEVLAKVQETASTVNASTVYRTLEVLEELGLVRHAHLSDRAPTYHSVRGHEHFHLVCRGCRSVTSVDAAEAAPFVAVLEAKGFVPDLGHLTVFGRCADCEGEPS
ncbi:Fur family ferric uptake transcriptional regulator [Nocardioides aromaticivorans]|uniref:Fur family ferric uptake transcriptional regulator n=1 Tax=Nocardioides aromaticivorans TaxID=200618 RepID=A0A7Z0CMR8_9ACTN|nr:Fur family transcriptional regulator [Nocardioides aromaticivorans]NYI44072.1 Fur family ferric uptake transcriptional regulator [Nocardioides aromaticivorans]